MSNCPPGTFCPAHPDAPALLFLTAVAIIALLLFATAAGALVCTLDTAARLIRRRLTRAAARRRASRAHARACVPRAQSQAHARARTTTPTRQYEWPRATSKEEGS
ncbi:hypothetical protein [Streptomyces fuscichromogenes]|uniref:Uncharacterized protein n=1 Tax=Streptomyces fuscichromogenes TaxID=1324013 RepID=A0A918CY11_9ACTN|nr:hypothetical protein [Streptomyces fuscichromogenes]GGN47512.1 hypothetical protein GCM10011578_101100 [Streptomyces fuscichromogenes]